MYYLYSGNKDVDQLLGWRTADLRLCFRICAKNGFPYDAAHMSRRLVSLALTGN